jgi:hypothetical protein
MDEGRKRV